MIRAMCFHIPLRSPVVPALLSGGKYSSGVGFPFDCTDGFPSKQFSAKDAATGPREESQFSKSLLLICHAI